MPNLRANRRLIMRRRIVEAALPGPPTTTFIKTISLGTGGGTTSFSQSGLNIFTASADVVLVLAFTVADNVTVSDPVLGGISGTVIKTDATNVSVALIQFLVPNSTNLTSATLTMTLSAILFNNSISGWFSIPQSQLVSTTAVNSQTATSAGATAVTINNLTTNAGGTVIAAAFNGDFTSTTTWTGANEDYDTVNGGGANTGAHIDGVSASASYTLTTTFTNSSASRITAASWR